LAKSGNFSAALATAKAAGFEQQVAQASAAELMLLADAASHAGEPRRALSVFGLVRERFSGTPHATLAAFALGRLQFDSFSSHSQAARWFRTYLAEAPSGVFAREALGRLMEALAGSGDEAGARSAAQRYLKRYPSGPHAALASRLADAP
jgi:TolA-binding protein